MKERTLGVLSPLTVSSIGLGCMGMSHGYGPAANVDEVLDSIHIQGDRYNANNQANVWN